MSLFLALFAGFCMAEVLNRWREGGRDPVVTGLIGVAAVLSAVLAFW